MGKTGVESGVGIIVGVGMAVCREVDVAVGGRSGGVEVQVWVA